MALYRMGMRSGRGVLGCHGSDGAGKQDVGGLLCWLWFSLRKLDENARVEFAVCCLNVLRICVFHRVEPLPQSVQICRGQLVHRCGPKR